MYCANAASAFGDRSRDRAIVPISCHELGLNADPMERFLSWLDSLPLYYLVLPAAVLGLAPFYPEPHLWEKLVMLSAGELVRLVDIFDLVMHGVPVALLAIRLGRDLSRRARR